MDHGPRAASVALLALAAIGLAGCASATVPPPDIVDTWTPPPGAEDFTPLPCDEAGEVFAYDPQAPLDIQETSQRREEGVTIIDLTYASPMGGRVPATLVVPDGAGPFAGMLYQHGMPSTRQALIPAAVTYARMGAVVLLIDAPFARRPNGMDEPLTFTDQDRHEQIQLIVDLRRGIDLLLSRSEVDPKRLAYVGISYGGAMGGLLAGVEDRLKAYVLQVGDGGLVTHSTGPEDGEWWLDEPEDEWRQWLAWMWPIEPIHYVRCAAPAALLFQNGTVDAMVPPADGLRYREAGSEPKTARWYRAGHMLDADAGRDQAQWLSQMIGIAVRRPLPRSADFALTAWLLLVVAGLIALAVDLWRVRPAPHGARLMWLLATAFLGPLAFLIYWICGRHPTTDETPAGMSSAWRALGSSAWAAPGNVLGGIGVLALLLYVPFVFGRYLVLQVAVTFLLPFAVGGLTFALSRSLSRSDPDFLRAHRRPIFAEAVSTCLVLTGVYPTVNLLISRYIAFWSEPFGFGLFHLPLWGALCLAAMIGTLLAYPFHLWMIRRGVIAWGQAPAAPRHDLAWYAKTALIVLAFAIMIGAIFLSMQFA
jgi:poly(3-hydroxybutyrate) depolymerase